MKVRKSQPQHADVRGKPKWEKPRTAGPRQNPLQQKILQETQKTYRH